MFGYLKAGLLACVLLFAFPLKNSGVGNSSLPPQRNKLTVAGTAQAFTWFPFNAVQCTTTLSAANIGLLSKILIYTFAFSEYFL